MDSDADGFSAPEDCADTDPAVHPGAAEEWDDADQDCDGRVDGDGSYTGTMKVDATAIYEGTPYRYSLSCPGTLSRSLGHFSWVATCTPDPNDPMAQLLLGPSLILSAEDDVSGAEWTGDATVASSTGWDTYGAGTVRWSGFDLVSVSVALSKVSLSLSAKGSFGWDG